MKRNIFRPTGLLLFLCGLVYAQMTVKDSDTNILMRINDEGIAGSISMTAGAAPSSTLGKLYNQGGTLYWNGSELGTAGSAGGWTDVGTVVHLITGTDKVGIGDATPTYTLDVAGKIGINDNQVLYLPDQSNFLGTLFVGTGGNSLSHSSGGEGYFTTAIGIGALYANTIGSHNTACGYQALYSNTIGSTNTAIGIAALNANTEGDANTACGVLALYNNTTGNNNTANGNQALYNNTSGWDNTAYGVGALHHNTTGNYNTAIGYQANVYNQAGSFNTIIGHGAGCGTSDHDKSGNVFLGYQAGYNETGDNKLYIENSESSTPLIGGDFATDEIYLNGTVKTRGTQILYLPDQSTFPNTLFVGTGGSSLTYTSGSDGEYNTAVGIMALNDITTGNHNTAIGVMALGFNTIGYQNTATGAGALTISTSGNRNTANGGSSLSLNTTGNFNTATGYAALSINTTGNSNTAIGYFANVSSDNLSNATAIGANTTVDASNKVRIGDSAVTVIEGEVDFTYSSDKNKKENFLEVDGNDVLNEIRQLDLQSWNYIGHDPETQRHYGPTAQDFFQAFGQDAIGKVGTDKTLCGSDVDGINMIAIQALEMRTNELQAQNNELVKEVKALKSMIFELGAR
ncbi:tail fiber domain-containing protein [bacterium]